MDDLSRIVVRIMGREYPVVSRDSPEHVRKVAALVDQRMRVIASAGHHSIDRVAVLAALKLANDAIRLEEQSAKDREELQRLRTELDKLNYQVPVIHTASLRDETPRTPRGSGGSRPKTPTA